MMDDGGWMMVDGWMEGWMEWKWVEADRHSTPRDAMLMNPAERGESADRTG